MNGFTLIDSADSRINGSASDDPVSSLMHLLGGDDGGNEVDDDEDIETQGSQPGEAPLDQMGRHSGDEDPEQPDEHSEPDGQKYRVRVNGEEMEVTLNELREGFQLKSDYTRKMQELADSRNEMSQRAQAIEQSRQQYAQMLKAMEERYEALIPPEPNWEQLAKDDPAQYTRQRAAWDRLQKQLQSVQEERGKVQAEQNAQHQARMQQYLQGQRDALLKHRPDLSDPEKWNSHFNDLNNYAIHEMGFSPQEVGSFLDHRVYLLLEKAHKYDALQNPGAQGSKGKPAGSKREIPNLAPGSKTRETAGNAKSRKAQQRLAKSGSLQDAAAAIAARM